MAVPTSARDHFLAAVELFDSRVQSVAGDHWTAPSPCEGWEARDVVAHAVGNLRALGEAVAGGDFFASFGQPVEGEIVAAWDDARDTVAATIQAADSVDTVKVGGNPVPVVVMIDSLMRDLVIHTWDLARAVGGDERLPDHLVAAATEAMAMVGDSMRVPGLYGQIVDTADDVDAQTRLLALSGRHA